MRIGFFGNNNNYPLLLAEALQRRGHDVVFVVNKRERLHRPESRDPARYGSYPEWMLDAAHLAEWDFMSLQPGIGDVLDRLADCDALVLNDLGPSLLPLLGRPAITFLTGSDLDYYGDLALPDLRLAQVSADYRASVAGLTHRRRIAEFVARQRQGLAQSLGVNWALPGLFPSLDRMLADCGVTATQVFNLQMADLERIGEVPFPHGERLRIFCGTRLNWKLPVAPGRSLLDYKGTDVMIRGVARFVAETGNAVELCLVRKGMHVKETEQLVQDEGLAAQVTWLDEMPLQDLWRQFQQSDVVVEQLGGSIISMVALDAMACGRPVIGNVRPEVPTPFSAPDSPVCAAASAAEVCAQLRRLVDPATRRQIGAASRAFVERHFSPDGAADSCLQRLLPLGPRPATRGARPWLLHALRAARSAADECQQDLASVLAGAGATQPQALKALRQTWEDERRRLVQSLLTLREDRRGTLVWQRLKARFARESGHSWTVALPELEALADGEQPERSGLLLFENERLLGPAHATHDDIRQLGAGRFSHWRRQLYFSTSDGSDPNTNGRSYTIVLPTPKH